MTPEELAQVQALLAKATPEQKASLSKSLTTAPASQPQADGTLAPPSKGTWNGENFAASTRKSPVAQAPDVPEVASQAAYDKQQAAKAEANRRAQANKVAWADKEKRDAEMYSDRKLKNILSGISGAGVL